MRVATLTFHYTHNYGSLLQAYALQACLRKLGVHSDILDYRFPCSAENMSATTAHSSGNWNTRARWCLEKLFFESRLETRAAKTLAFIKNDLHISAESYHDEIDLDHAVRGYDAFITGSDQVWNCSLPFFTGAFLLDFVPDSVRKISYAASFGLSALPRSREAQFRDALASFHALSVREPQGIEIVRHVAGREAICVLDPTLLLDSADWAALAPGDPPCTGEYIFCYFMDRLRGPVRQILRAIRRTYGQPMINMGLSNPIDPFRPGIRYVVEAGPRDFIRYMRHCSAVVTNSFHAAAFSLVFGKPLCVFAASSPFRAAMSSRITAIVDRFKLHDCVQDVGEPFGGRIVLRRDTYDAVIERLRGESLGFLRSALDIHSA